MEAADALGYDTIWVPEAYSWEAFSQLGAFAGVTRRIQLATGIVNVFSRSPALLGQAAATVDRISGGRFRLGLGTSGPQVVNGWHGVPYELPIQRLREAVDIVRLTVARERLSYDGSVFKLHGGLKLVNEPPRRFVPIYLATLTPAGLRLAGEIADGWLGTFVSPAHFQDVLRPELETGISRRSESLGQLTTCALHMVVLEEDSVAARNAVRPLLSMYLGGMGSPRHNYYNRLFCRYGFAKEAAEVRRLFQERRRDDAAAAVSDEMVDAVTIHGDAQSCRNSIQALIDSGPQEVALQLAPRDDSIDTWIGCLEALAP